MNYQQFSHLAGGLADIATTLAVLIGGFWAYRRYVRNREAWPKIEFTVDVTFVHKQCGVWLVEAVAFLENKGGVRIEISEFVFDIRYMLPTDPVEAKNGFFVFVPNKSAQGSWLPESWKFTFIEPGLRTRYSCIAQVPAQASVVLIHGKFFYANGTCHTADKLVEVPSTKSGQAVSKLTGNAPLFAQH